MIHKKTILVFTLITLFVMGLVCACNIALPDTDGIDASQTRAQAELIREQEAAAKLAEEKQKAEKEAAEKEALEKENAILAAKEAAEKEAREKEKALLAQQIAAEKEAAVAAAVAQALEEWETARAQEDAVHAQIEAEQKEAAIAAAVAQALEEWQAAHPEPEPEPEPQFEPMPELDGPEKLTLMVYMAADNDLETYAIQNLKAMEHSRFADMNVLVLVDRAQSYDATNSDWTDTRLFELKHDETDGNFIVSKRLRCPILGISEKSETELNMSNPSVLRNFITFAKSEYEAEKYALIIWGHGTGWRSENRAVAFDDYTNSYMTVSDMGRALKNQGLCVIGFDTCFAGVFENVYEIKGCAEYTVGCPGVSPSCGWNYKQLLEDISDSDFTAKNIARFMAESSPVNTSVFNNSSLSEVMTTFEDFSEALSKTIVDKASQTLIFNGLKELIDNHKAYYYSQGKSDIYLDIFSLAQNYSTAVNTDNSIKTKSIKLKNELSRAIWTTGSQDPLVGIHYIPRTEYGTLANQHSTEYFKDFDNGSQCMFIKESQWWVPSKSKNSGSLLDKLFYKNF